MRPLLIAEAANPEWVSVPLEGWSHATAIQRATGGAAHIVTQIRNREAFLRAGLEEGRDFTAIDSEAVAKWVTIAASRMRRGGGKGWTTVMALNVLSYPYFERLVWREFGPRIASGEFGIVHRLTPLSPTLPSPIARKVAKAGAKFVIGPLNGGLPWPREFDAERRREQEWLSYLRGAYKLLPGRRATLAHAAAIIVGSKHTWSEVPTAFRDKCAYIAENAIDPARFPPGPPAGGGQVLRACFIGRLVPYKCPDILIEAAAPLIREGRLLLDILGDGPLRPALEAQVAREGVEAGVTFHGMVPHGEVQTVARRSDLFAFPSVREFGGAVAIEAMALGVVPIVADYGGPGEHVTPETGFAIPMGDRASLTASLKAQLETIAADPARLPAMAAAAKERVDTLYTWDAKAQQVLDVYRWLDTGGEAPNPFGYAPPA